MPELPEIETICRGIAKEILNYKISVVVVKNYSLRKPIPDKLAQILVGQSIKKIKRCGKYILLFTSRGCLIIHLGMSGNLQIKSKDHIFSNHEHVNIVFANNLALCYIDPRRFGLIVWTDQGPLQHVLLKNQGLEPLTKKFTAKYLFDHARYRKVSIKPFLMDNKIVVGIGNIYANEALFAAGVNPLCRVSSITLKRFKILVVSIKSILKNAIKYRGTTFRDYCDGQGKKGNFQTQLKIYGRQRKNCLKCKAKLKQVYISQRSTVFCPRCQK